MRFPRINATGAMIATAGLLLVAAWWLRPFFDLRINPQFNSDSAMVFAAITERVPLAENIFQWGSARNGSLLVLSGWIYHALLGHWRLVDFIWIINLGLFLLGCCTWIRTAGGDKPSYIIAPLALVAVLPNFYQTLSINNFTTTVTDIAHRPESLFLVVLISWLSLSLADHRGPARRRGLRIAATAIVLAAAAWVTDAALVYGAIFVALMFFRAWLCRSRFPFELIGTWLFGWLVMRVLRTISIHGAWQMRELYRFPDAAAIRQWLGSAVLNLWGTITPATWLGVFVMAGAIVTTLLVRGRPRPVIQGEDKILWHAINLYCAGIAGLLLPFASKHVYDNHMHLRYFSPAALLLCVAAVQAAVALFQLSVKTRRPLIFASFAGLALLPLVSTFPEHIKVRQQLAAAGESNLYKAGVMLRKHGVREIIGPFWDSYAYLLSNPGYFRAMPTETISRIGTWNSLRVLGGARIGWIAQDPAELKPVMTLRGVEFRERDASAPFQLPTGRFCKTYKPTGVIQLKFGEPESNLFLRDGWSEFGRDTTHSWAWAFLPRATMELPLNPKRRYEMEVTGTAGELPCNEIRLLCNGQLIATWAPQAGSAFSERVLLPETSSGEKFRRLEFQFGAAPQGRESARRAAAFDEARITVQPK